MFGGWAAAQVAKRDHLLHGALPAVGCNMLGVYAWIAGLGAVKPWVHIAFLFLAPALGALGGFVATRFPRVTVTETDDETIALAGRAKALLFADYAVIAVCSLSVLAFGGLASLASGQVAEDSRVGATMLAGYSALLAVLVFAAARALKRRNPFHRRFHVGAALMVLLPLLLVLASGMHA